MKRKILATILSAAAIFAAGTLTACSHKGGSHTHAWDDGDIASPASCSSRGLIVYTCTQCGEIKSEILPQLEHEHSDEWLKNADEHWHMATCRHTGTRVGVAPHDWGEGEVIVAATCYKRGLRKFTCVCGETKTEAIEKTEHSFSQTYSKDDDKHWRVCTVEGCNGITDEHAHNWNDGEITTPATCQAEGEKTVTCTDCGKTQTETVAIADHSYGENWAYDASGHYHACTTKGCSEKTDQAGHTYGEWSTEGRISRLCTTCGYEQLAPALSAGVTTVTTTVGGGVKGAVNVLSAKKGNYTVSYNGSVPVTVTCQYYNAANTLVTSQHTLSPENVSFTVQLPERAVACLFIESQSETAFACQLGLSVK